MDSSLQNRITNCNEAIVRKKVIQENNKKKIEQIQNIYLTVQNKLNDDARALINSSFPEFNDKEYIASLDKASIEELKDFGKKLEGLITYLLNYIEEIIE